MKEFIEKLIEKMKSKTVPLGFGLIPDERVIREKDLIEIVNQLAEEYKKQNIDQDLMIVESLPSVYPLQPFEVEAIDSVVGSAKHSDGWIPCSERLPEENQNVIACFKTGTVCSLVFYNGLFHGKFDYSTAVIIAWQPLPDPYIPNKE